MDSYPAISDLEARAKKRIPSFAWTYLESGTGDDVARDHNRSALESVRFRPQFLKGILTPTTETTLFGITYAAPIGIAPVGLTGLIWPGADAMLATTAARNRIPYVLSTVGTEAPEVAGPKSDGMGWFQLYPPRDPDMRDDMVERAAASGFTALVVTADVPAPSRRERQRKARLRVPPTIGPRLVASSAIRPTWSIGMLRNGLPPIVEALDGTVPVLFDSGIRDGLDIARALALGADFCFAGRPFLFGLGALGENGASHAYEILHDGLTTTMHQVGVESLRDLGARLASRA